MSVERLRGLWRDGKPVSAAWLSTTDGLIAETVARGGFDVLVLDMQHGMAIGPDRAAAWLQAVGNADVAALARVPWNEPVHIQYILDAGADGVIVPLVASPAEAARAAGACRYPPLGFRSWGPNRARYRAEGDYLTWANEQVLCFALIEHIDAVNQIEAIVQTPGLDGVFIGPNDLGFSMGQLPGRHDEQHAAACRRVVEVARAADRVAGFYAGGGPAEALRHVDQGFNFCPIASDVGLIRDGAAAAIERFQRG
ncbi:MAG: 2,4-dihydroxyhept-2-ene-1,7-dioic acid aldolase [Dehalococcoidia bacterium]|nr:2,4-dihydroxyhept-2-ene-1,7-dioic acid aldolase [Dehalococcoidia bacterium]